MTTFIVRLVMAIHLGFEVHFLNYLVWGLSSWPVGVGAFSSPSACGFSLILLFGGTLFFYFFWALVCPSLWRLRSSEPRGWLFMTLCALVI